jgi:uncharacterized protein (TIGR02265 family)
LTLPLTVHSFETVKWDFHIPDWSEPLDLTERMRAVPPEATVKGMFIEAPISVAQARSGQRPGRREYIPFKDYPVAEHNQVLVACAMAGYPDVPLREGLRRLGRDALRTFLESLAGRVLFAAAGRNFDAALGLVARSYGITGPVGSATVAERTVDSVLIQLRSCFNFPDCYHVGVFEAAMDHFRQPGEVMIHVRSVCDVDLKMVLET